MDFVVLALVLWAQRKFSFKSLIFIELLYNMLYKYTTWEIFFKQIVSNSGQKVGEVEEVEYIRDRPEILK